MYAGAPQQPDDDDSRQRHRGRIAVWCQIAGAVLALATLTCSLLDLISAQQAIALGLAAALLIVGGLIADAVPDLPVGYRSGFRAGLRAASVLSRLRTLFRRRSKEGLAARRLANRGPETVRATA
jgi:hypothetical protein